MATAATAELNALVIGGTGATGKCLIGALLRDKDRFGKVVLVTRRKVESVAEEYNVNLAEEEGSGRLVQHIQDLDEITKEKIVELCTGCHVFFNTLGTTRSVAGSAQAFYHIDCEIPFKFAEAAKEAGVSHMSLLTSSGAKSSSFLLYYRTKGELEDKIRALQFPHTSILRPGFLNRGPTERLVEKIAGFLFKGLPVSTLAAAMAWDAVVCAQKGQTSGDPTVSVIDAKQAFIDSAQEYLKAFAPKAPEGKKTEEAKPQAEGAQPNEGGTPSQDQQPAKAEVQPRAEEQQPQAQTQEEETQRQTEETQPQADEPQPQADEAQPQADEAQPQADEAQPQAEESQPQAEESQPQAEEAQPEVDETQEDAKPKDEETETNPEEAHPEGDESPSQGEGAQ